MRGLLQGNENELSPPAPGPRLSKIQHLTRDAKVSLNSKHAILAPQYEHQIFLIIHDHEAGLFGQAS